MAISPDGARLAYAPQAGLRAVTVMDVATGDTRSWTAGTDGNIRTLSWAPDGRRVAAVFRVEGGDLIELLDPSARGSDLDAGRQILKPEDGPIVDSGVYAMDGASLVGAETNGDVVRLPIADRPPTTTVITKAKADRVLALAGSGRYLLIARGTIVLRLDLLTGKSSPMALPGPKPNSSDDFNVAW